MRLNGFDLNQLVCLDALLRERNVSRAAEKVHLSQSAMSWTLAQLRTYFDDPLLVRSGRALVLTPFATSLVGPVSELLGHAQGFIARTPGQMQVEAERVLRIAASDYVVSAGLSRVIQMATEAFSNLRVELLPLSLSSSQYIANGEADLLFAGQALDTGMPPNELVFEDRFTCLVCARLGRNLKSLSQAEYLSKRHIVLRYFEHQLTFEDEEALRRQGIARERQVSVWAHSLVPPLLCGTDWVATVAERAAKEMVARWPLRLVPFPFAQDPVRTYVYWHRSRSEDPMVASFLGIARNVFRAKGRRGPAGQTRH